MPANALPLSPVRPFRVSPLLLTVTAAGALAGLITLVGAQIEAGGSLAVETMQEGLPALVEITAGKHQLRAPGATQQAMVVRYDPGVLAAFHNFARSHPVTQVNAPGTFAFSMDRPAAQPAGPVALASIDILPPRRPPDLRQAPSIPQALPQALPQAVTAAMAEPSAAPGEEEPRILNIRVPGLGAARAAVAATGQAVSATASEASAVVGRGLDAGLSLIRP